MNEPPALRQQIAKAIHRNRFPDSTWDRQPAAIQNDYLNCADAVIAALREHLDIRDAEAWCKSCRRVWDGADHRCESGAEQRLARIREVASTWFLAGEPGPTRTAGKYLLGICDQSAHNDGPSVAEAAADDRRWWDGEKTGEGAE